MHLNQNQRVSNIPDVRFPPDAGGRRRNKLMGILIRQAEKVDAGMRGP